MLRAAAAHAHDMTLLTLRLPTTLPLRAASTGKPGQRKPTTPVGKLDPEPPAPTAHPHQEQQPLPPHPNNTNPATGEVGGPRGPEPTRYGDWERKGRVTDF